MEIAFLHLLKCSKLKWMKWMDDLFIQNFGEGPQDMTDNTFCYVMHFIVFYKTSRAHPLPHTFIL